MNVVHLLDYVAGNVRSLENAVEKLGYSIQWVRRPEDIASADRLILPGVGHFGHCVKELSKGGYLDAIRDHIDSGKPFMGICVGMQVLFNGSEEDPDVRGFGMINETLKRFDATDKSVPQIGWNTAWSKANDAQCCYGLNSQSRYYYVHSYAALYDNLQADRFSQGNWNTATSRYGDEEFVGAIWRDNVFATQFHPEKSGAAGLRVLKAFLSNQVMTGTSNVAGTMAETPGLSRRLVACLDVRNDEAGTLVVTKGDQYDVRDHEGRQVRNLGNPVDMAKQYYEQGADEITFLNITSFRNCPVEDLPMLGMLQDTSKTVFVPLTIGGGIRDVRNPDGRIVSALEVATMYFKSGADKVSIGSDAVLAAEDFIRRGSKGDGTTAIETISKAYGNQAVVVSVDPRRIYVQSRAETTHHAIETTRKGPRGEKFCWYQCTIKGGREGRDLDVKQLVQAVEKLGAGEILLNCIDQDGCNEGFDLELVRDVKASVRIPVIASSGAGKPEHFLDAFEKAHADAALGAGMFHRGEYSFQQVKDYLQAHNQKIRIYEDKV